MESNFIQEKACEENVLEKEHYILDDIFDLIIKDKEHIIKMYEAFTKVKKDILELDNNFFGDGLTESLSFSRITMTKDVLESHLVSYDRILEDIAYLKENACKNHEWVNDTIDISPEKSENICYCAVCEVTKK
jgi:hypothetical protein